MRRHAILAAIPVLLLLAGCGSTITATGDAGIDPGSDPAADAADAAGDPDAVDPRPDTTGPPCGAGAPVACPDGYFCELPEGECDPDAVAGACVEIPVDGCYELWAPECGCDGVTYDNDCYRLQAGQHLLHAGACEPGPVCFPGAGTCDEGQICEIPLDSCWLDGVTGTCTPIRDDCGFLWDPQCGCDGVTYTNECERMAALVGPDHWGECGEECGRSSDPPCADGTFCELPTGFCTPAGIPGECIGIPEDCPGIYAPVCGCDGVTYGNDCERRGARAQLHHTGEC